MEKKIEVLEKVVKERGSICKKDMKLRRQRTRSKSGTTRCYMKICIKVKDLECPGLPAVLGANRACLGNRPQLQGCLEEDWLLRPEPRSRCHNVRVTMESGAEEELLTPLMERDLSGDNDIHIVKGRVNNGSALLITEKTIRLLLLTILNDIAPIMTTTLDLLVLPDTKGASGTEGARRT